MRSFLKILTVIQVIVLVTFTTTIFHSCDEDDLGRTTPERHRIDPEFGPLTVEFLLRAEARNIILPKLINIELTDVPSDKVIGVCHFLKRGKYREIDIDRKWWDKSSDLSRKILVFHEMTHCYCTRDHTFGPDADTLYDTGFAKHVDRLLGKLLFSMEDRGFFEDGCPLSIMYPSILPDWCSRDHFDHYMKEMLNSCRPYR